MTESILYSRSNLDLLHSHDPSKILLSALCSTRFLHSGWLELESLPALFEPWELFSYNLLVIARDVCRRCRFNPWVGEDLLEEETATHFSILAWKIPWIEEPDGYSPQSHKESDMTEHTCACVNKQLEAYLKQMKNASAKK